MLDRGLQMTIPAMRKGPLEIHPVTGSQCPVLRVPRTVDGNRKWDMFGDGCTGGSDGSGTWDGELGASRNYNRRAATMSAAEALQEA